MFGKNSATKESHDEHDSVHRATTGVAEKLAAEGACRSFILEALMEVAIKIARDDPRDSSLIQLEDAAGFLPDTVHGHRRKQRRSPGSERRKKRDQAPRQHYGNKSYLMGKPGNEIKELVCLVSVGK